MSRHEVHCAVHDPSPGHCDCRVSGSSAQRPVPSHMRIIARSVLRQLQEAHPREDIDLDAVRALANYVVDRIP